MKTTTNNPGKALIEIIVDLERADIEKDLQKAAKHFSEHLSIDGFRKGLAPYDLVCSKAGGEAKIYEAALESMVSKTLSNALKESKVKTMGSPKITIEKMVPPFGIKYKAEFSVMPFVELCDVSKISVEKKKVSVSEEDIKKVIQNLLKSRVKESSVARGAEKGDKIVIDFEISQNGVPVENGSSKNFEVIFGESNLIPGFEEQLLGLKPKDKKTFSLDFPKNYFQKFLAGKTADFNVNVIAVFSRELPEFNDDFVKSFGAKTSKEMEEQIKERLVFEKENEEKERFEMSAMDELVKNSKIGEISDLIIQDEAKKMVKEVEDDIERRGGKIEEYLSSIKKTRQDLEKEFLSKAEQRIKISIVGRAFMESEQISVKESDVDAEIEVYKKAYQSNPEMILKLESRENREYLWNMLTSRKIFKVLAEKVSSKK
jgi:trigger factor